MTEVVDLSGDKPGEPGASGLFQVVVPIDDVRPVRAAQDNVVGDRVLVAVQAVNISRLSTHTVPIVPGTLVVVAGAGPKDSNGAGKSSFIAAITALLGDEQWRFASGAKAVSELLFNAELAAHGDQQWASADHGYIVGVFDVPSAGVPVTVWVRVNQEAPHLEVRWAEGVHLATAASEAERVTHADVIWSGLPKSAGRRDVVARDLTRVLYGDRVRCVSFLSTSVRSKVATNLLSQPLNEISPDRIFEAIAALTGLDAELDQEREARRDEHAKRVRAEDAQQRLADFEDESRHLLAAFDRRDKARERLADALKHWRGRLARRVADAAEAEGTLAAQRAEFDAAAETAESAIAEVKAEIAALRDDSLDRALATARRELAAIQASAARVEAERAVAQNTADQLRAQIPALEEQRRRADGRDPARARAELAEARKVHAEALKALGVADREHETAQAALRDAENGPAAAQLTALGLAGIPAAGLLDALDVAEQARDSGHSAPAGSAALAADRSRAAVTEALGDGPAEARGTATGAHSPDQIRDSVGGAGTRAADVAGHARDAAARDAVVVDAADMDAAAKALAGFPGSVVVSSSGVTVVGMAEAQVTGRDARVKAAAKRVERAVAAQEAAASAVRRAEDGVTAAERRVEGAEAADRLAELATRLDAQRDRLTELTAAAGELTPALDAAEEQVGALDFRARTRDVEADRLDGRRHALTARRDEARAGAARIEAQRTALGLDRLVRDWGGTVEGAQEWLAADELTADEWWRAAERHLDAALRGTFDDGDEMPEELAYLIAARKDGRAAEELATFQAVCNALGSYLRAQEEYERHQRRQIETQITTRRRDLAAATRGAEEAAQSTAVHRATLTEAIRARLTRVAEEFDRLDTGYGGYGAALDFPVPAAPADPEQRWSWRVVPKWKRGEGQGYVPYNRRANTALMDEKAVKLVCAAAIASSGGKHLTLVLDELGRNLGKEHRREAVALFRRIGETYGITVIGALQDDMEPYAIDACGQYVKLRRSSDAMAYNEPPIIIAHDKHADRVRMLTDFVTRT
ncbi:chromosome partitioning protein ParA [Herbidospora galbida]|uniref:chromosome partitioning protein ParA n=1 Tax=Herbidospora galbida TaxID=2575442 RepID=UPI001FEC50DF|nr:chromosome partitioning protein ParA [Herbidospora galbida]